MHRGPILFEQVLEVSEKDMAETFRRMQRDFLHHNVRFGEGDAAGFGSGIEGKDHFCSSYTRSSV